MLDLATVLALMPPGMMLERLSGETWRACVLSPTEGRYDDRSRIATSVLCSSPLQALVECFDDLYRQQEKTGSKTP